MSSTWVQIATEGSDVTFNTIIANSYSGSVTGSVTGNLDGTSSWASSSLVAYEAPYYTTTASFNTFSSSYVITSASFDGRLNSITTSFVNFSGSYVTDSSSFNSRILSNSSSLYTFSSSYVVTSASFDSRIDIVSSSLVNVSSSYDSFTRTYNTGSFTGSFIGAFTGDGSGITNISASSVVGLVLSQIASGSITASVSPAYGFTVNASASVSGTFAVSSSTNAAAFKGSGSGLFTVDGTSGRLFTIDDTLTGTLLSVQDALSNPILEVNSDGSVIVSGSIEVTQGITASLQGTASWAVKALTASYADNFIVKGTLTAQTLVVETISSSVVYSSGSNVFGNSLSNTHQFTGSVSVTGSLSVNGSDVIRTDQTSSMSVLSASYARTASEAPRYTTTASFNSFTQSYINDSSSFNTRIINNSSSVWLLSGSYTTTSASFTAFSSSYILDSASFKAGLTNLIQRTESFATTGSNIFRGDQTITGSIYGLGNNEFIGSSSFYGQTFISGGLIISSSQNQTPATFQIYGDIRQRGGHFYLPVDLTINPTISGSYIFSSGSTNDLYFGQNANGSFNVTRLRWLEGNLYTGLLHGGLITVVTGSTTFNVSSGSGIIVSMNASIDTDPYPSVKFVNWGSFTNHPITFLTSSIQTFVGIDANGQITQQTTPFVNGEYESKILLGTVLHQNQATVNSSITYPNVAYGYKQRTYDFIKAFGPLKLSGLGINTSGSLGLTVGSGTAWADGRNYQVNPNNPSYITDPGTNVSKIFRYYQSGSSFVQDTNGGLGYAVIDPSNYNPDGSGSLQPVPGTGANREWSVQRVFWYPNSATKGIVVYYGTRTYPTSTDAIANIQYEQFFETPNTQQNAVYLGAIALRNNATFSDPSSYNILPGGIFRSIGGSGGGGTAPSARFIDLADVNVVSPTDGQTVIYDSINSKWINSSYLSASISGNAETATSASYTLSSSYAINSTSASYASTASYALNVPETASYSLQSLSASLAQIAISASYATTASYAMNAAGGGISAIYIADEGLLQGTASYFDFTGAGVTATVSNGTASIAITGGGGGTAIQGASQVFTQSIAASTWSFAHSINSRTPVVEVYDSNYNVIIPTNIQNPGPFQTDIYFDVPESGYAVISTGGVLAVSGSNAILNQSVAAATWSFSHDLHTQYPVFTIYDDNDDVIVPQRIHVVDTASALIYFSTPRTGKAVASLGGNIGFTSASLSSSYAESSSYATFATTSSYSDGMIIGSSLSNYVTVLSSSIGSNIVSSQATGSYTAAFFKYTVASGSNARAGEVFSVWNTGNVEFTDVSTNDIGTTMGVTGSVNISGGNIQFIVQTDSSGWTIKSIATFI